jgi:phosphoribosylaminoimidazole carboxylase
MRQRCLRAADEIANPRSNKSTAPHHVLSPALPFLQDFGYPLMLKSRRLAYDGRGNAVVQSAEGVAAAWAQLAPKGGLYAEKWVPFRRELAVIVARGADGSCVGYDAVETIQKNNICHVVVAPAQVPGDVLARAREVAQRAVSHFTGAGVYGVELFELADGAILLNEMAPRVHNSGHHTIEACHTSQFEQHIRAVAGLPLGDPSMRVGAAVMVNVLGTGAAPEDAQRTWAICQRALATPGASVHWYGKAGTTLGRKVGHVTVTGQWMPDVLRKALAIAEGGAATGAAIAAAQGPAPVPSWVAARAPLVGIIMGIAAAGGAAHLPGMVAAMTPLPVIGVPVPLKHLDGVDSLYSIVQMPRGVPVATVAIGNSTNAALLAARILGSFVGSVGDAMEAYQRKIEGEVLDKVSTLERVGWEQYGKQPGGAHK